MGRIDGFLADPQTASFAGDLNGNAQISISTDGSTWLDLGPLTGITAPLQTGGIRTTVHGEQDAPTGTYSWVRVTMSGVRARLNAGSVFGNTFLTGSTEVPLGGGDVIVEVALQVPLRAGCRRIAATIHHVHHELLCMDDRGGFAGVGGRRRGHRGGCDSFGYGRIELLTLAAADGLQERGLVRRDQRDPRPKSIIRGSRNADSFGATRQIRVLIDDPRQHYPRQHRLTP